MTVMLEANLATPAQTDMASCRCKSLRVVQSPCAESRVADGTMTMEEARTRNQQLLKRQHFGRTPPDVRKFF